MAHVVDNEVYACTDCLMIVANDDASGMDDKQEQASRGGIQTLLSSVAGGYLAVGDTEQGFSHTPCDVCGALAGERHQLLLLGDEEQD